MGTERAANGTDPATPDGTTAGGRWPAHRLPVLVACLVSVAAFGWRMVEVTEWPFPFYNSVQYESALASRAIWVAVSPAARTPEREAWYREVGFFHAVSPPVLPALVAACYVATGEEIPWVSKVFAAGFWVGAGWLAFAAVVRQGGNRWAATAALTYLTFTPFGQLVSRSFQTESVVVFAFALAVWCLSRPGRGLGWRETAAAGLVCGLAAAVKPGTLQFPLAVGFAAWALAASGDVWRKVAATGLFVALLLLPSVAYVAVRLSDRGGMIQPHLLADAAFYRQVADLLSKTLEYPALAVGLLGAALAARARHPLALGLFVGHALYVGTFTYHCSTHSYYHTTLVVPVAVGVGWVVRPLVEVVRAVSEVLSRAAGIRDPASRARWIVAASMLAALARYIFLAGTPWAGPHRWKPENRAGLEAEYAKEEAMVAAARAVAAAMGPGDRAVALTTDYGYVFEFWANRRVAVWPRAADLTFLVAAGAERPGHLAEHRLDAYIAAGRNYFAVCDFREYAAQPGLRAALARRGTLVLNRPDVLLFELR